MFYVKILGNKYDAFEFYDSVTSKSLFIMQPRYTAHPFHLRSGIIVSPKNYKKIHKKALMIAKLFK